ncbi:hypothetical protein E1091_06775 [Micromonospora fluostatini]|uniref:Uncharacterized protein n=1 Tax=Micromonospora fluostatini TaxID=1629071 RepID=A0ABY2DJF0_9ACTN|nr:hypothetical protein E1091_06775 [Micromonospora fluostatini]
MPRVIVPVGFSLGPQHRYVHPPDPVPETWEVHLGGDVVDLTEAELGAYGFAYVDVRGHAKLQVNRRELVRSLTAAPNSPPDAEALVTALIRRGLLLEFDPDGPLEQVFRRYRLFPTAEGLGTTPEEPEYHRMGHHGQPRVAVHNTAYVMWAFSFLHPNLWAACEYLAAEDEEEDQADADRGSAQEIAQEVAANLPMMIATQCAFLDPVVEL